jgi:hypothetical protein
MYIELSPAYGRDYKSGKEVKAAFDAHKDFKGDYSMGFRLVNKPQIPAGSTVLLRYKGMRSVVSHKVVA